MKNLFLSTTISFTLSTFAISSSLKQCQMSSDCKNDEYCDIILERCLCRDGKLKHIRKGICIEPKQYNETCEYDLQCHQYKSLGLICESNRCICPKNKPPDSDGKCKSYGIQSNKMLPTVVPLEYQTPKYYSRVLLVIGICSLSLMTVALSIFMLKIAYNKRYKTARILSANSTSESSSILATGSNPTGESRHSRPPSYSSLPPPSYEDVSSSLLPGVTAWWRSLRTVPESDKEGSAYGTVGQREEAQDKAPNEQHITDSTPSAPAPEEEKDPSKPGEDATKSEEAP